MPNILIGGVYKCLMKKQERIESAQKRIQELKKLIDLWLKNEKTKTH